MSKCLINSNLLHNIPSFRREIIFLKVIFSKMEGQESFSTFCEELKVKTRKVHDESDKTVNLKLAVVLTDTRLWATALADFYFVFQNLEKCMESNSSHPNIGPLCNRDMFR